MNFAKEFPLIDGKTDIYLVPMDQFTLVEQEPSKTAFSSKTLKASLPVKETKSTSSEASREISVLELNALDLYALIHAKPVSKKAEVNEIISKYL